MLFVRSRAAVTTMLTVLLLFGVAGCLRSLHLVAETPAGTDYTAFATGGRLISSVPHELFNLTTQLKFQTEVLGAKPYPHIVGYVNPPLVAWLLQPIAHLPLVSGLEIFLLLIVLCGVGCAVLVGLLLPHTLPKRQRLLIQLVFGFSPGMATALVLAQMEPFLWVFLLMSLFLVERGRLVWAGVFLAGVAVKPQYLWTVPLLFVFCRQWRLLAGLGIGLAFWAITTVAMVGVSGVGDYIGLLRGDPPALSLTSLATEYGLPDQAGLIAAAFVLVLTLVLAWMSRERLSKDPGLCCMLGIAISTAVAPHISGPAPLLVSAYLLWRIRSTNRVPIPELALTYLCSGLYYYTSSRLGIVLFDGYLVAVPILIPLLLRRSPPALPVVAA